MAADTMLLGRFNTKPTRRMAHLIRPTMSRPARRAGTRTAQQYFV